MIGKFPPIQGGVSMRTYCVAHALAARGHEVHVVTNAKEVQPPFRMLMQSADWQRCEARLGAGSVKVHWTDPLDRSQRTIPLASAFVSKLAGMAIRLHDEHPFDVIYSHYLEPYGVAAHLAAQACGTPHVARLAGSDAGRLWHHAQLEALYDHVLRSTEVVIASGIVAERAVEHGVSRARIAGGGQFVLPEDLFSPSGPKLDLPTLRTAVNHDPELRGTLWGGFAGDRPHFGICGKLGPNKGSFALLAAMQRLKAAGVDVGLVALAHGAPDIENKFRAEATKLGLVENILQIPFLPHWRVPEFLRSCLAVCCLEQDFPIGFHTPIIPFEVLLSGTCLIASTEVLRKLPAHARLPHGYGCVAIHDVNDVEELSGRLAAIAQDSALTTTVGLRGRIFAREIQRALEFPHALEQVLQAAAARRRVRGAKSVRQPRERQDGFAVTRLARAAMKGGAARGNDMEGGSIDLRAVRDVLAALERSVRAGQTNLRPLALGVRIETAIAAAELDRGGPAAEEACDPLFRLSVRRWALAPNDIVHLVPRRDPRVRILEFAFDVADFLGARTLAQLPTSPHERPSFMVAFRRLPNDERNPLVIDAFTARILNLSDGTRTVQEILNECGGDASAERDRDWIEKLFVDGLISLHDRRPDPLGASESGRVRKGAGHDVATREL
ncbi:MAG: glycosyltransferase [Xanthobacteraceae bacterium]